jgi:uncharacterized protein (DUF1800 family)
MSSPDQALIALHRFGLGARPGALARVAANPRGSVLDQLGQTTALPANTLAASDKAIRTARLDELQRQDEQKRLAGEAAAMDSPGAKPKLQSRPLAQTIYLEEATARFTALATTDTPLIERLALFWTNHFAIAINKAPVLRASAGAFEREAIRPHIFGRFADMLRAASQHPAMLVYLDNFQSIGPNSRAGERNQRGLNENLAREILELHTLGVDGGYTQEDVTSFARILTGWTMVAPGDDDFFGGRFTFSPARHEPGAQSLRGKRYDQANVEQGVAALDDLARHPSTARHIARKLARHFISDAPPQRLVQELQDTFVSTGGDLLAVTGALLKAPEAWSAPLTKIRSPQLFLAALARAGQRRPETPGLLNQLNLLGQPLWQPPGPNGFPDAEDAWASPEGMVVRMDVAMQWARLNATLDPNALTEEILGKAATRETREAVARAGSRAQGLAILFMSPEFQRC